MRASNFLLSNVVTPIKLVFIFNNEDVNEDRSPAKERVQGMTGRLQRLIFNTKCISRLKCIHSRNYSYCHQYLTSQIRFLECDIRLVRLRMDRHFEIRRQFPQLLYIFIIDGNGVSYKTPHPRGWVALARMDSRQKFLC